MGGSADATAANGRVLKRLSEVAHHEYPFPLPPRDPKKRRRRLNLTSWTNLRPVLRSVARGSLNLLAPWIVLACVIAYATTGSRWAAYVGVALTVRSLVVDPFLWHGLTNGRFGLRDDVDDDDFARDGVYCRSSPRNDRLRKRLSDAFLPYRPTPWLVSGDWLTLWPFLRFKGSRGGRVAYDRWWVRVPAAPAPDGDDGPNKHRPFVPSDNDEAVAVDLALPETGHDPSRAGPALLILHGLNGGSTEPYVLDLVRRCRAEGRTAAVLVARGLARTPLRGPESFTGARTSDVARVVDALSVALSDDDGRPAKLVLVGFSMGAILAANYVAKAGPRSGVLGSVAFSGTIDSGRMLSNSRAVVHSRRVWQPALAWGLKATIVNPMLARADEIVDVDPARHAALTNDVIDRLTTVSEIDARLVCSYHRYGDDVADYYEDLSAAGRGDARGAARLNRVATPLLVVHARDDPIAPFGAVVGAALIPRTTNVLLLRTTHGGHIGWPRGWFPSEHRWSFMVGVATEFADAVAEEADRAAADDDDEA